MTNVLCINDRGDITILKWTWNLPEITTWAAPLALATKRLTIPIGPIVKIFRYARKYTWLCH